MTAGKYRRVIEYALFLVYFLIAVLYFAGPIARGELIAPGDSFDQNYPLRLFYSFSHYPDLLWLPYQFLGLPFLGTLQTGLFYPLNFLYFLLPAPFVFNFNIILHYAFAAFFTFLYVRLLGVRVFPAFIAGLVFGFSGFLMAHKGHVSMVNAAVWLPLLLYLYEKIRQELRLKHAALASLVVAIQVFAGHYQICVYSYIVLGLFFLFYLRSIDKDKRARFFFLTLGPVVLGSIIALPQIWATMELSDIAWRAGVGYRFFVEYSFPPFMLPQLIFPFLFGVAYGGPYWGIPNLTEMAGFIGTLPLVLGLWVAVRFWRRNTHVQFLGLLGLVTFLLALGGYNPFYRLMYYVPVYNLFRVPARHWLEFDLAIALLFGLALNYLIYDQAGRQKRKEVVLVVGAATLGALGLVYLGKSLVASDLFPRIFTQEARSILAQAIRFKNPAVFIPLLFLGFYLIWSCLFTKTVYFSEKEKAECAMSALADKPFATLWKKVILGALAVVVLAEGFSFGGFHDACYVKISEIQKEIDNPLMHFLKEKAQHERVAFVNKEGLPLYNVPAKICTLNGYDPLIPAAVHELLDMWPNGVSTAWDVLLRNNLIFSTLNTRFIVVPREDVANFKPGEIKAGSGGSHYRQIPLAAWELINSKAKGGEFSLKSSDGLAVSMLHQRLTFTPNTHYLLIIKARAPGSTPTSVLSFDLCGPNYDFPGQELDVMPEEMNGTWRTFYKVINTGSNIPPQVELRVFTFSREPIEVRDIEVKEIQNFTPPFMGQAELPPGEEAFLYRKVLEADKWVVYENRNCLPRVFPVQKLEPTENIQEVKRRFELLEFNPAESALVSRKDLNKIVRADFSKGRAVISSYGADRISIDTDFENGPGFVVLSDQYFPGWKAYVNGKETPVYCVDGLLRGVVVPQGKNVVEFWYRPWKVYAAGIAGLLALGLALAGVFVSGFRQRVEGKGSQRL